MEALLEKYLLLNKNCPLPGIGTLEIRQKPAVAVFSENSISAPAPQILLVGEERGADQLVDFLASEQSLSREEAVEQLSAFCTKLQSMDSYRESVLEHTGRFYVNADGKLAFRQMAIPAELLPTVKASRLLRQDAVHQVRVGDTETDSVAMAEYLNGQPAPKSRWWIWAACLLLAGIAAIFLYFNKPGHNSSFGKSTPMIYTTGGETYRPVN